MEIIFDNPGHQEALTKLGVLRENETRITPQELITRTLETGRSEAVTYILRQEIANYFQGLAFLEFGIEVTGEDLDNAKERKALRELGIRINIMDYTFYKARVQGEIVAATALKLCEVAATPTALDHLEVITSLRNQTKELIAEKGQGFASNIQSLKDKLSRLKGSF